jgi:hypothetical protein
MADLPPGLAPARETIVGKEDLPFAFQWFNVGLGHVGRDSLEFSGGYGLWKPDRGHCWLEKKVTVREKTITSERLALSQPLLFFGQRLLSR